jgi:hypothetical protein
VPHDSEIIIFFKNLFIDVKVLSTLRNVEIGLSTIETHFSTYIERSEKRKLKNRRITKRKPVEIFLGSFEVGCKRSQLRFAFG